MNSSDPRLENQAGAVRDVNDPEVQEDTVSGGAPDEPDTSSGADAASPGESDA